jgi:hypothetical protein
LVLAVAPHARGQVLDKCQAAKIKAAGKKTYDKAKCRATALTKGLAIDPLCLSKAEDKFVKAITKADTLGSCSGTATDLEAAVDQCVDSYAAVVSAPVTTTTTTTTVIGTTSTTLACADLCVHDADCCSGFFCSSGLCREIVPCGSATYWQCGGTCPVGQSCYPVVDLSLATSQGSCRCAYTGLPCGGGGADCGSGNACAQFPYAGSPSCGIANAF